MFADTMTQADFLSNAEVEEMFATIAGNDFEIRTDAAWVADCDMVAEDWAAVINACGCKSPLCPCH